MRWLFIIFIIVSTAHADPGCNNAILTWEPVTGAIGYFIYWRDNSKQYDNSRRIYVGNTNGHPLDDFVPVPQKYLLLESGDRLLLESGDMLLMNNRYYITVTALDDNGCESDYADEIVYYGGKPLTIIW